MSKKARSAPVNFKDTLIRAKLEGSNSVLSELKEILRSQAQKKGDEIISVLTDAHRLFSSASLDFPEASIKLHIANLKRRKVSVSKARIKLEHDELCNICKDGGSLLCCDTCSLAFHIGCCQPSLSCIPEGVWRCSYCLHDDNPQNNEELRNIKLMLVKAKLLERDPEKSEKNGPEEGLIGVMKSGNRFVVRLLDNDTLNVVNSSPILTKLTGVSNASGLSSESDRYYSLSRAIHVGERAEDVLAERKVTESDDNTEVECIYCSDKPLYCVFCGCLKCHTKIEKDSFIECIECGSKTHSFCVDSSIVITESEYKCIMCKPDALKRKPIEGISETQTANRLVASLKRKASTMETSSERSEGSKSDSGETSTVLAVENANTIPASKILSIIESMIVRSSNEEIARNTPKGSNYRVWDAQEVQLMNSFRNQASEQDLKLVLESLLKQKQNLIDRLLTEDGVNYIEKPTTATGISFINSILKGSINIKSDIFKTSLYNKAFGPQVFSANCGLPSDYVSKSLYPNIYYNRGQSHPLMRTNGPGFHVAQANAYRGMEKMEGRDGEHGPIPGVQPFSYINSRPDYRPSHFGAGIGVDQSKLAYSSQHKIGPWMVMQNGPSAGSVLLPPPSSVGSAVPGISGIPGGGHYTGRVNPVVPIGVRPGQKPLSESGNEIEESLLLLPHYQHGAVAGPAYMKRPINPMMVGRLDGSEHQLHQQYVRAGGNTMIRVPHPDGGGVNGKSLVQQGNNMPNSSNFSAISSGPLLLSGNKSKQ